MLGGEVVEGQQLLPVLDQTGRRLGVLGIVDPDEGVERLLGLLARPLNLLADEVLSPFLRTGPWPFLLDRERNTCRTYREAHASPSPLE